MKTKVIETREISAEVHKNLQSNTSTLAMLTLFGGDRLLCCDEGLGLFDDQDRMIGMATIAPKGESYKGIPTIVGIWVHPKYRKKGNGKILFEATIRRCLKRGFNQIRVDLLSRGSRALCDSLLEDLLQMLEINDQSGSRISDALEL